MTKAAQRAHVGQGLALGLLALGRQGFEGEKTAVEFSFRRAWRDWPEAHRFPQVHADIHRVDLLPILHESPRQRSSPAPVHWCSVWPAVIELAEDWSVEEVADLQHSWTGVALDGWVDLAARFIRELESMPT